MQAANSSLEELRKLDEGRAMNLMAKGAANIVKGLYARKELDGIIVIGGGMGAAAASTALRELPIGVPKLLVSTMKLVQAGIRWYVDGKDIMLLPCPADIIGLNRITKKILAMAAYAISNMVKADVKVEEKPLVAISTLGTTNRLASRVRMLLEEKGFEPIVFHTIGPGGESFETFVKENFIS